MGRSPDARQTAGTGSPRAAQAGASGRRAPSAGRVGERRAARRGSRRKACGLFLAPARTADVMGGRVAATGDEARVLDPAAGLGAFCRSAVAALVSRRPRPEATERVCEVDGELTAPARAVLDRRRLNAARSERPRAHRSQRLHPGERRCGAAARTVSRAFAGGGFDAVIANPPVSRSASPIHARRRFRARFAAGQTSTRSSWRSPPRCAARVGAASSSRLGVSLPGPASGVLERVLRHDPADLGPRVRRPARRASPTRRCRGTSSSPVSGRAAGARPVSARVSPYRPASARRTWAKRRAAGFLPTQRSISRPWAKILRSPARAGGDNALTSSWPAGLLGLGLDISTGPAAPFRATAPVSREGRARRAARRSLDESCARHAGHGPWAGTARMHRASRRRLAARFARELRSPVPLQRRGSSAPACGRSLDRRFCARRCRLGEPPQPRSPARRHAFGGCVRGEGALGLCNRRLLGAWFRAADAGAQLGATALRAMPPTKRPSRSASGRNAWRIPSPGWTRWWRASSAGPH